MQHLSVLHENVVIGKILLAALTALGSCVLVTSFVLCGDVYGGGPAFVAFSNGVAVCSFVGWHWYVAVATALVGLTLCLVVPSSWH